MDYSLLKNKVYLALLAFYNSKDLPSFIELGKVIGVSRQTASVKVKELISNNLIELNDENVVFVKNPLNINIDLLKQYLSTNYEFNVVELKMFLFPELYTTKAQCAKDLKISRSSIYLDSHSVVYAICLDNHIKYIGTTKHYQDRILQHIKKRPFLKESNFIILVDNVNKKGFNIELELIHLLQPEWNIMGIEKD